MGSIDFPRKDRQPLWRTTSRCVANHLSAKRRNVECSRSGRALMREVAMPDGISIASVGNQHPGSEQNQRLPCVPNTATQAAVCAGQASARLRKHVGKHGSQLSCCDLISLKLVQVAIPEEISHLVRFSVWIATNMRQATAFRGGPVCRIDPDMNPFARVVHRNG